MLGQDPTYAYSNIGGRLKNRKTRFSDGLSVSKPAKPRPVTQTACVAAPHTLPWRLRLSESAASAQPNPLFRHSRAGGNLGGLGQLFISSKLPAIEKDSRLRGDDVSEKTKSVFFFQMAFHAQTSKHPPSQKPRAWLRHTPYLNGRSRLKNRKTRFSDGLFADAPRGGGFIRAPSRPRRLRPHLPRPARAAGRRFRVGRVRPVR